MHWFLCFWIFDEKTKVKKVGSYCLSGCDGKTHNKNEDFFEIEYELDCYLKISLLQMRLLRK